MRKSGKYSQNDEDLIIERYFRNFTGWLLDIGSNDGVSLSNTLAAAERGWTGIYIEPSKTAFEKLCNYHLQNNLPTGSLFYNLAIGEEDGEAEFFESGEHLGTGDTSLISTLKESELERWRGTKFDNFTKTTTKVQTWKSFYEGLPIKEFQLVSIDAEGNDFMIMSQMDFTLMGTKMLIIEYNGKEEDKFKEVASKHGLKLLAKNGENLIYAK